MRSADMGRSLKTTETSLSVVEAIKELDGARVTELADHLDLNKSTVHNHLSTLRNRGYVVMEGDEYHLGLRFTNLGFAAKNRKRAFRGARQLAQRLARETGLDSDFIVEENGRGVYLKTEAETDDPNIFPQVGDPIFLHSTAAGKAILAAYPDERVETVLDRWGMPALTENTITDRDALFEDLERVRDRGYSFNRGENKEGVLAVGAAIQETEGSVLGAISLSAQSYRMSGEWFEEELPEVLLESVREFEDDL